MNLKLKILLFAVILTWNAGIYLGILTPLVSDSVLFYPMLHKGYSLVCHQQDAKLMEFFGIKTMVCSRCSGIYLGTLVFAFLLIFVKFSKNFRIEYLILSAVPMIVDIILYSIGLYKYSKPTAFSTGFLFGSVGFYYFYISLEKLIVEQRTKLVT